jgi:hypothetical protein
MVQELDKLSKDEIKLLFMVFIDERHSCSDSA